MRKNREQVIEKPLVVFCCYPRTDQWFLLQLKNWLRPLEYDGLIIVRADVDIRPGEEWEAKINHYLTTAHIILLLVSSDLIASKYCYGVEMKKAMERHDRGEACVIPIILRTVNLRRVPFGKIQSLPTNAKPIKKWTDRDDAFFDVMNGIEKAIEALISSSRTEVPLVQYLYAADGNPSE